MTSYESWFQSVTSAGGRAPQTPHPWQSRLASDTQCASRVIRIPTGMGKTAGMVLAWLWHRTVQRDPAWPRRLVYCLPMRVLVEQTVDEIRRWLDGLGLLWDGQGDHTGKVGVHVLMGGEDAGGWHLHPEHDAVIVGTQDMLLSRALMRGYAAPRARWPMEFAALHQDALWVLDEVQLMDVGLTTAAQLQAFRTQDSERWIRPAHTWFASATLQDAWLETVDVQQAMGSLPRLEVEQAEQQGPLWQVRKPLQTQPCDGHRAFAERVVEVHRASAPGAHGRVTLAVVNRVETAAEVFAHVEKCLGKNRGSIDLRLVHARFRPHERAGWREAFLSRTACTPDVDRILVATQVVEAGVDLNATTLVTELAPWPSLVQRFGRAGRYGEDAQVLVLDTGAKDDKQAAPYALAELDAVRAVLPDLEHVDAAALSAFESREPARFATLFPYTPAHVLVREELEELFDTTPDLTGNELDVSRFIRSGDDHDVRVFWRNLGTEAPAATVTPGRTETCTVPLWKAKEWIGRAEHLEGRVWRWDWQEATWIKLGNPRDVRPGETLLVDAAGGGYDALRGWDPKSSTAVQPVPEERTPDDRLTRADAGQSNDALSEAEWRTIATHGAEVSAEVVRLAAHLDLEPRIRDLLSLAGRWHDVGKSHPVFQGAIEKRPDALAARTDLAKAPPEVWSRGYAVPGFRHELASTLALFESLRGAAPTHPALTGDLAALLHARYGDTALRDGPVVGEPLASELRALSREEFDLVAFLVCAHHGKVRCAWSMTPDDQDASGGGTRIVIRGVPDDSSLPPLRVAARDGAVEISSMQLSLEPASLGLSARYGDPWVDRVMGLLDQRGPFTLAFLESLLRVADQRASSSTGLGPDPLLAG